MFRGLFKSKKQSDQTVKSRTSEQSAHSQKSKKSPKAPKSSSQGATANTKATKGRTQPASSKAAKSAPNKKAWTVAEYKVEPAEGKTRFHDLGLEDGLLHAIADLQYQYCSEIQAASLPYTLQGHDFIGKAQTGTGKTAAFLITIINDFMLRPVPAEDRFSSEPRALILAPTRELALQIEKDARALTKYAGLSIYSVLGGIDYQKQREYVRNNVIDILVATPGRLIDFLNSGDLYLDQVDTLVIDE
ncbi:DEAD/DEAH box helicase, partial [Oleiphilus sp. HI0080]